MFKYPCRWEHVVAGHFNVELANNRSVFTIAEEELKVILQSEVVVKSPVSLQFGGQFVRIVDVGTVVGKTSLKFGGENTTFIKVFTDIAGNLISTYPVPGQ